MADLHRNATSAYENYTKYEMMAYDWEMRANDILRVGQWDQEDVWWPHHVLACDMAEKYRAIAEYYLAEWNAIRNTWKLPEDTPVLKINKF